MTTAAEAQPDLTDADSLTSWTREKIRFQDIDRLGHVNNVTIAAYAESGRVEMLADVMPSALEGSGAPFWVIAQLNIRFREQAHYPGHVDIGTRVLRLGNRSLGLGQGMFVDGRCIATTEAVVVLVDPATARATTLPDEVRAALGGTTRTN